MSSVETLERPAPPRVQRDSPTEPFVVSQMASSTPRAASAALIDSSPDLEKTTPDLDPTDTPPEPQAIFDDEPEDDFDLPPPAARAVPEMLPPPKTNVQVDGLPSVIVDEPEAPEAALRKRAPVRVSTRGANPWNHAAPAQAAPAMMPPPAERTYSSAPTAVLPRTARRRRGLLTVAVISFLVVFVTGAAVLGVHWYLRRTGRGRSRAYRGRDAKLHVIRLDDPLRANVGRAVKSRS